MTLNSILKNKQGLQLNLSLLLKFLETFYGSYFFKIEIAFTEIHPNGIKLILK
jgi:hypothetical protein